jgi:hypothetical protein
MNTDWGFFVSLQAYSRETGEFLFKATAYCYVYKDCSGTIKISEGDHTLNCWWLPVEGSWFKNRDRHDLEYTPYIYDERFLDLDTDSLEDLAKRNTALLLPLNEMDLVVSLLPYDFD